MPAAVLGTTLVLRLSPSALSKAQLSFALETSIPRKNIDLGSSKRIPSTHCAHLPCTCRVLALDYRSVFSCLTGGGYGASSAEQSPSFGCQKNSTGTLGVK